MVGMADKPEAGRLVRAVADNDQEAWNELVRRFASPVMAVIRSYRLTPADAEDVYQTVWLKLVEHLGSLRDPEALPGWLRSTTMHECIRQLERRRRTVPVDPQSEQAARQPSPDDIEAAAIRAELRAALRDGLAELSEEDQALLRLYALAEPYKSVAELLQMKTGSIGPTLGRSLARLRQTRALRRYLGTQPAPEHQKGGDQLELAPLDR
jgi:RNA polymerase sigma factor (sigma-70 family)